MYSGKLLRSVCTWESINGISGKISKKRITIVLRYGIKTAARFGRPLLLKKCTKGRSDAMSI
jgi:hypothetical protein